MKVARAFQKYEAAAKPIDLVANLGFGKFKATELEVFPPTCGRLLADCIADGLTMDEVLEILRDSWLGAHRRKFPNQATLQLVSPGHELRGIDSYTGATEHWGFDSSKASSSRV